MKSKVSYSKRNVGSDPTPSQVRSGASTSMGSNKSIRTRGGRGSFEGYQSGSRADIIPRDKGYMAPNAQKARQQYRGDRNIDSNMGSMSFAKGRNIAAMSNIGMQYTGSSKILYDRMRLNRI